VRTTLTLAAAAVAIGGVLAAPAGPASADDSAQNTISYWENQGYQVNIDRVGSGPINECVVTSVRHPNTITRLVRVNGGGGSRGRDRSYLVPVIVSQTVNLSLNCAN
jgi:hypothetical protein